VSAPRPENEDVVPEYDEESPRAPRPADYFLPVGATASPPGKGWKLVDYSWDEKTGIARLAFRRKWNPAERVVVEVQQPASECHEGWQQKPEINRDAVLARYFESQRVQMHMQAIGAYGR
jgi:hypothetical protein